MRVRLMRVRDFPYKHLAGRIGKNNGERRRGVPVPRQTQNQLVAGDEKIRMTARGEFKEFLIVRVAATRHGDRRRIGLGGVAKLRYLSIALEQFALCLGRAFEFGVGADTLEFGEAVGVAKAAGLAADDQFADLHRCRIAEMQPVHHDIGIEDEADGRGCRDLSGGVLFWEGCIHRMSDYRRPGVSDAWPGKLGWGWVK